MYGRGGRGGGGGQVCQFFLQGRCKFGSMYRRVHIHGSPFDHPPKTELTWTSDNCKNEHPSGQGNAQSQGGFGNRFSALNNNNQAGSSSMSAFSLFFPSFSSSCFNAPAL